MKSVLGPEKLWMISKLVNKDLNAGLVSCFCIVVDGSDFFRFRLVELFERT